MRKGSVRYQPGSEQDTLRAMSTLAQREPSNVIFAHATNRGWRITSDFGDVMGSYFAARATSTGQVDVYYHEVTWTETGRVEDIQRIALVDFDA